MNLIRYMIIALFISIQTAKADEFIHRVLCEADIQAKKNLSLNSSDELWSLGNTLYDITSLEEFASAIGVDYQDSLYAIAKARKISVEQAKPIALKMYRDIEFSRISRVINLKKPGTTIDWDAEFKQCIDESKVIMEDK